jgi:aryl-alcohol dehydrogenase-like predicted oxidoreductase
MQYWTIPGIDKPASVIALGTGSYGASRTAAQAFRLLDRFVECGGTLLDTAQIYPPSDPGGSERIVGQWLAARGLQGSIVVGTKGGHPLLDAMHQSRLGPEDLAHDLAGSLARLDLSRIDLYWLHRDDPAIPVGEILDVLNGFADRGLVGAIGASNWSAERLTEAGTWAKTAGKRMFVASQLGWSLAKPGDAGGYYGMLAVDSELEAYHRRMALPLFAYSSQANGFFGPKGEAAVAHPEGSEAAGLKSYLSAENQGRLHRALAVARRCGRSANQVALAWLLGHDWWVVPIAGCSTVEQVADSCAASELALTPQEQSYLIEE